MDDFDENTKRVFSLFLCLQHDFSPLYLSSPSTFLRLSLHFFVLKRHCPKTPTLTGPSVVAAAISSPLSVLQAHERPPLQAGTNSSKVSRRKTLLHVKSDTNEFANGVVLRVLFKLTAQTDRQERPPSAQTRAQIASFFLLDFFKEHDN
ncbi:uncharacterized protein V6R79_006720 [Siganus canaliculatus]